MRLLNAHIIFISPADFADNRRKNINSFSEIPYEVFLAKGIGASV